MLCTLQALLLYLYLRLNAAAAKTERGQAS